MCNVSVHGNVVVHVPCHMSYVEICERPGAPRVSTARPDATRGPPARRDHMDQFGNCHGRDRPDGRVVSISMVVSTLSSAHAHRREGGAVSDLLSPADRGRRKKSPALLSRTLHVAQAEARRPDAATLRKDPGGNQYTQGLHNAALTSRNVQRPHRTSHGISVL